MNKNSPLISIAIPTFNRMAVLEKALNSLENQSFQSFEVYVVDNGPSSDGTKDMVRRFCDGNSRYHYLPIGSLGCIIARNLGFRQNSSKILLTIDDDVELVDPATLTYIVECFESDPLLGVLGLSEFLPGDKGKGKAVAREAPRTWKWTLRDTGLYPPGKINRWGFIGTKLYHLPFGRLHDVDHVRSSAMAIRREAFESVGGFIEAYTAMGYGYRYETDLCIRIQKRGYKIVYSAREPQVFHKVSERPRGWKRDGFDLNYLFYTNRNNIFFFLMNYWSRSTAWIFLLWDMLVGSTQQPGLLRFALYHRSPTVKIARAIKGKWAGWKMYRHFRGDTS